MCDSDNHQGFIVDTSVTRRSLVLSMSAAAAVTGLPTAFSLQTSLRRTSLCPRPMVTPTRRFSILGGRARGRLLMWPDILGLRPVFREMGRRLASAGYTVLVPNPFYRVKRAPIVTGAFDFANPQDMAKLNGLRDALTGSAIDRDAAAFVTYLDRQKQTNLRKGAGVQGYCFSGPFAFHTGAARSDRIRAVATFHGGGLVTKDSDSPHLLIPRTRASFVVAIARNDDQKQPDAKDVLKATFASAKRPAIVEVYPADHGWCVAGSQTYDQPSAERAWTELLRLYRANLA